MRECGFESDRFHHHNLGHCINAGLGSKAARLFLANCFVGCGSLYVLREIPRIAGISATGLPDHSGRSIWPIANIHQVCNASFDTWGTLSH